MARCLNTAHDAAVIPMGFYPYWELPGSATRRFAAAKRYKNWHKHDFEGRFQDRAGPGSGQIGPVSSSDVAAGRNRLKWRVVGLAIRQDRAGIICGVAGALWRGEGATAFKKRYGP